jgi:CubicO group peptidase (beta-lactamase class C family)
MARRLTDAGLDGVHAAAARHVGPGSVPGLVALVACGDQVHVEALGELTLGGPPVTRDSIFRIASTTKPITAAVTLSLVAAGRLDLGEPVSRLLPELATPVVLRRIDGPVGDTVPAEREVTVRDLLTFTNGFGMPAEMFTAVAALPIVEETKRVGLSALGPPDPGLNLTPDAWVERLGRLPLMAQPGERWLYNAAASVLGVLVARAAGAPFGEVLAARLFEPLAMVDTGFFTTATGRLATAYQQDDGLLVARDSPTGGWSRPPAFEDGAAGLVSTVDDLLAFARMLLRGGDPVLPNALVEAMTSDQLTAAQKARGGLGPGFFDHRSWGFGLAVNDDGSYGWDGGLGTSWLVDPGRDLTVVVLTQRMFDSPQPPAVHGDVQAAAYAALA